MIEQSRGKAQVIRTVGGALAFLCATILAGCAAPAISPAAPVEQVVFVCEHGNVKSLMAASYFNQLAAERNLSVRAISRGVAPDSTTVPAPVVAGLREEGIDVSDFQPLALSARDASESRHVVAIGTDLPEPMRPIAASVEQWNDVPPASTNYAAARDSLRAHVRNLFERVSSQARR